MLQDLQDQRRSMTGQACPATASACFKAQTGAGIAALDIGHRYLHSASFYKNGEEAGAGIRASGVPRDELYVPSNLWPTDYDAPLRFLDRTLSRLGLGRLDAYLLHWPGTGPERRLKAADTLLLGV